MGVPSGLRTTPRTTIASADAANKRRAVQTAFWIGLSSVKLLSGISGERGWLPPF